MQHPAAFGAALLFIFTMGVGQPLRADTEPKRSPTPRASAGKEAWSEGELGRQAEQLVARWRSFGKVSRFRPQLMERGDTTRLLISPAMLDPTSEDCVTVAALSMPNLSFLLLFEDEELDPRRRAWPIPSAAGVAEVSRCGARKPLLAALSTSMRSRRGVVEIVVARSEHPPVPATEVLRGRSAGSTVPSPQVGKRPFLAPLQVRLAKAKLSLRQIGAEQVIESGHVSDDKGQGSIVLHLEKGCHRLQLLSDPNPQSPPDLDARLSSLNAGEVIAIDEEQSGQAELHHCVGRTERFRLEFSGAAPKSEVTLLRGHFQLPEGLPVSWGPVARAHLARALSEVGLPSFSTPPTFATLGVRGTTTFVVEVHPQSCSVIALAPIRGTPRRLSLAARWGTQIRENQTMGLHEGTALTMCARGDPRVQLEIQAVGESMAWLLGVWPLSYENPESQW